jgi:transposase-like protein
MVEETHLRGASVPEVAHGVNANLLSVWRRLYRRGLLNGQATAAAATLLPVEDSTPTMLPTERAVAPKAIKTHRALSIEVEFASGQRSSALKTNSILVRAIRVSPCPKIP